MVESIVWFDLETTGLNTVKDRIIEICLIKTDLNGNLIKTYKTLVNPGPNAEISPGAQDKHGISIEELRDYDEFHVFANEIVDFIGDSHLGGYNILYFDIPVLVEELARVGILFNHRKHKVIDPFLIYTKYEPRNLESYYERITGKKLKGAHRAETDVAATIEIFESQKEKYKLPSVQEIDQLVNAKRYTNVDIAGKLAFDENGKIIINFGKHKGKDFKYVYETDSNYLDWIINKGEFHAETKIIVKKLKSKMEKEIDL
tara:strand:- start:4371 stop:5147 length:777 start_codon:yes stop_codon:yes gene_type:complete